MLMYKGVIFDLDGTLLNTLEDLSEACNYALAAFHYPQRGKEEICSFIGNGVAQLMRRALPQNVDDNTFHAVLEAFLKYYSAHSQDNTAPYPGIERLLSDLKKYKIKTGIVSNKNDENVKKLADCYFTGLIDSAIGEKADVRRKPAPDAVNQLLRGWELSPEEVLYVGDSDVDIETAHNAGCDCAAVCWGYRTRESLSLAGARHLFDSSEELEQFIIGEMLYADQP